jgi:hypothetical protein
MLIRNTTLALLLATFTVVAVGPGCGESTPKKVTGTGGSGGKAGGTAGTGAAGSSAAGTTGGGAGTAGGGTGGGTAGSGAGGMDAAADAPADTAAGGADGGTGSDAMDAVPEAVKPDGGQGVTYMFPTDGQAWAYTPYGSTGGAPPSANNLATLSAPIGWDATNDADGVATSGSLKGTVKFTAAGDRIDFQAFTSATPKYDWTGYTISAKVKLVSGGNINATCPLTAWLYVSQAPDYMTRASPVVNLSTGNWVTITYDVATATIDITKINQMGVQITTGLNCPAVPDGGTDAAGEAGASDGAASDAADAGVSEGGTDASASDAADGGVTDAASSDGGDGAVVAPPTATTAVILIDNVIVSVK